MSLKKILTSVLLCCAVLFIPAFSQSTNYNDTLSQFGVYPEYGNPTSGRSDYQTPDEVVYGGEFLDRFLRMPQVEEQRFDVWGGDNVVPRDAANGMEDQTYSYWGGNVVQGDDGKNHLFTCRWPENITKGDKSGHELWHQSIVVHAVSDDPMGPYKVVEEIGKGHNPEVYQLRDGSYIVGVWYYTAYHAPTLNGPWTEMESTFDLKDPDAYMNYSNRTHAVRDDGSVIMMNKQGWMFINEAGDIHEHWKQLTNSSAYKRMPSDISKAIKLEDPVIWRDEIQYHCVYHDWNSPMGLYMRSPNGINWTWMEGKAYQSNNMMNILGFNEDWFTFKRPKIRIDKYGRATHMNWAVCDAHGKGNDKANDIHSSKNLIAPLSIQRRYIVLSPTDQIDATTKEIQIKLLAEQGFDPQKDIDLSSLKIGAPKTVNFGGGASYKSSEASDNDLTITFDALGNGITQDNFATKLMGQTSEGKLLFGFSALEKGKPVNTLRELVYTTNLPDTVFTKDTTVYVPYEAWNERDISLCLYNVSQDTIVKDLRKTINGNGSDSVSFEIKDLNDLSKTDSYRWILRILPKNAPLEDYIGIIEKKNVVIISNTTTMNDVQSHFALFPNPFTDELIIESHKTPFLKAALYDELGSLIFAQHLIGNQRNTLTPSYADVPVGFYILQLSGKSVAESYNVVRK